MAELVWKGKYVEGRRVQPSRVPLPVRTDEVQFADDAAAAASDANRLLLGDVSRTLPALLPDLEGRVALVYVDPPFDTGERFDFQATIPGAPDDAPRIAVPAYDDARGLERWLGWFSDTAWLVKDLLAEGGSLYVHLDAHAAHYAKVILDEVFGAAAFQREIVWRIGWISGFKSKARGWIRNHDTILFYAKGGRPRTFNKEYVPYPEGYVRRDGSLPRGAGYPIEDVWNASDVDRLDSIQIMSFSGEKVGYPTQKNEALVARIVRASSEPGDVVLDCFAGSGTTAVVAEKLGRRWICADVAPIAVHTARKRLLGLGARGKPPRPFVVQSVGPEPAPAVTRHVQAIVSARGPDVTIELAAFAVEGDFAGGARGSVSHWSQLLEGWCVDWDYRGGPLHARSRAWRVARGRDAGLPLALSHAYDRGGRYEAAVRAFDILGGSATTRLAIDVAELDPGIGRPGRA
jgi:hypothetical protein